MVKFAFGSVGIGTLSVRLWTQPRCPATKQSRSHSNCPRGPSRLIRLTRRTTRETTCQKTSLSEGFQVTRSWSDTSVTERHRGRPARKSGRHVYETDRSDRGRIVNCPAPGDSRMIYQAIRCIGASFISRASERGVVPQ